MDTLLAHVPFELDWRVDALCAQIDPDLWFPERGASPAKAKTICFDCPVRVQCLAEALACNERYGVWGGTTHDERRLIKNR